MKHDEESMKEISVCGNDAGVISQPRTITPMRPHEVVRTKLCEEDTKYRYFFFRHHVWLFRRLVLGLFTVV